MEKKVITGFIPGTESFINEYMLSLKNSIKEELSKNFPQENKEYHIYLKYNYKLRNIKVFVRLNQRTKVNLRNFHIYFLFTVGQEFPDKPPYVQCLTDFTFPSLCDCRNLLKCLCAEWKTNSTISSLIQNIPSLLNCFENDIQHSVLILYGEYIQYEHTYSINDFMLNNENILKKIQIMTQNEKGKTTYETRYLVITHLYLLIFYPEYLNNHSKVRMSFYGELRTIDFINRVSIDDEELKEKAALKIVWKPNAPRKLTNLLIVDQLENDEIKNIMIDRKTKIEQKFKLFHNDEDNSVDKLNRIIEIKENFLDKCYNEYCLKLINELYLKIIEIFSIQNDDGFKPYLERMHKLFNKFDMKTKKE